MSRRKQRSYGRGGLFEFDPTDPHAIREVPDVHRQPCPRRHNFPGVPPGCGAQPSEPCTSPSRRRGGRRPISGHHEARQRLTESITEGAP